MKEVYRHYGHSKFDRGRFMKVSNQGFSNKPFGGLWSCPTIDVDIDWRTWSESNEFNLEKLREHFDFTIKNSAKILEIKNIKDLDKLPRIPKDEVNYIIDTIEMNIDFEALATEYDGMMVWMYRNDTNYDDLFNYHNSMYYRMYGWDVDTMLIFNPDIIEEVI